MKTTTKEEKMSDVQTMIVWTVTCADSGHKLGTFLAPLDSIAAHRLAFTVFGTRNLDLSKKR